MKIYIIGFIIIAHAFFFTYVDMQNLDINILKSINLNRDKSLDSFFIWITNSSAVIAYGVPFMLLLISLTKGNIIMQKNSLYIIISLVVAAIIATSLKYGIDRARPFLIYSFIESISEGGSPSFPSGHTCDAFALTTAISLAYSRWYIIIPSFLWALAVGYSRMDLGVHYPSDVLGGIIIGCGAAFLCHTHPATTK